MYHRFFLMTLIFIAGISVGWMGKTWITPIQSQLITVEKQKSATLSDSVPKNSGQTSKPIIANNSDDSGIQNTPGNNPQYDQASSGDEPNRASIADAFEKLLDNQLYYDAIALYQEQKQRNEQAAAQLKPRFTSHLEQLRDSKRNNDFSELIDNYLSIYYDDIDVLLLLADFNKGNGSYPEVVDVYLLAKTYAYTDIDQENVISRFNNFVKEVDNSYTNQQNWGALIGLYSHIKTSGLMTSAHQYQQALAHLKSGDEFFAIEQLQLLLNDSLVGQSAAKALSNLTDGTEPPATINYSDWDDAESIALKKLGNQYLVNLANNQLDSISLLIDTGASMTAVSRESFNTLNAGGDAIQQERRDFQTANGVTTGTVYSVPELILGPYSIKNTQIAVIDFGTDRHIDGLLGMNILGQFQFQIDQENSRLLLRDK